MIRREFLSHALSFGFAAEALPPSSVTMEYLWGMRLITGDYEISKRHNPGMAAVCTVPVKDTVMARRMQSGDVCLLRQKADGTWEVVFRHQEGR